MKLKSYNFLLFFGIFAAFLLVLSSSLASAGFGDFVKTITGRLTSQPFNLSVSVGNSNPIVTNMFPNSSAITLSEATFLDVLFNFSVNDDDGYVNLNDATARLNFSRGGESTRSNTSCLRYQQAGDNANYSCTIKLYYYDGAGSWNVTAFIQDVSSAVAINATTIDVNQLTAFVRGPSSLTFGALTPGTTNTTSNNDPLLLNNTGNAPITAGNIQINATNLRGETTGALALWAGNFSVGTQTGSNDECGATGSTSMVGTYAFTAVAGSTLGKGNFSVNDGSTGQEQLYFCIKLAGSELSSQTYSTANATEGSWTIKIA